MGRRREMFEQNKYRELIILGAQVRLAELEQEKQRIRQILAEPLPRQDMTDVPAAATSADMGRAPAALHWMQRPENQDKVKAMRVKAAATRRRNKRNAT